MSVFTRQCVYGGFGIKGRLLCSPFLLAQELEASPYAGCRAVNSPVGQLACYRGVMSTIVMLVYFAYWSWFSGETSAYACGFGRVREQRSPPLCELAVRFEPVHESFAPSVECALTTTGASSSLSVDSILVFNRRCWYHGRGWFQNYFYDL